MNLSYANQLTDFLTQTKTYQVELEQKTFLSDRRNFYLIKGKLYLQFPNKMRWENEIPEKQTMIADGQLFWSYKSAISPVTPQPQDLALQGTAAEVLIHLHHLDDFYHIMALTADFYKLIPKDPRNQFQWISITFENHQINLINMETKSGQWIRLAFSNQQKNQDIDPQLFIFNRADEMKQGNISNND